TVTKTVAMSGQAGGGQTESRTGRLAGLDLGSLRLSQPLVSIAQTGPAHFAVEGAAGNIGGSILKKFRCTFDYARKEMILDPVSDLADPVPFDASGLVLITSGAAFDTITVSRVIPQSPAEEAGLQVGDQLLSVDGKPVTDLGVVRLRERLRQAGSSVTLAVSRGTRTWTVPLQLRQLLERFRPAQRAGLRASPRATNVPRMPISKDQAREVVRRLTQWGTVEELAKRLEPRTEESHPLPASVPRPGDWSAEAR